MGHAAAGANSWTKGADAPTFHPCRGFLRDYGPKDITGDVKSGNRLVCSAASLHHSEHGIGGRPSWQGRPFARALILVNHDAVSI